MADLEARAATPPPGLPPSARAEAITTKQRSLLGLTVRRFMRHKLAMGSLAVLLLVAAYAFIGPYVWPYDHTINPGVPSGASPSREHPFGTTNAGHDVFAQVMRGTQQSLKVAITASVVSSVIGALWGATAGLFGGRVDNLMMRIVDIVLVVPLLVLVTAVAGNIRGGASWWAVALIIALFAWTTSARVVRGLVLSMREQEFIEASYALGASRRRIVFRHLLPNASGPIIVAATITFALAVLAEAALSFLGFGIQPPDTSLGRLINDARTAAFTRPWLFYPPGVIIVLIALTINFIGDGLRDALDPRQSKVRR